MENFEVNIFSVSRISNFKVTVYIFGNTISDNLVTELFRVLYFYRQALTNTCSMYYSVEKKVLTCLS